MVQGGPQLRSLLQLLSNVVQSFGRIHLRARLLQQQGDALLQVCVALLFRVHPQPLQRLLGRG
eukprot:scaffold170_cov281-Pinguiococcus_pyrenoidosus.AAC.6